MIEGGYKIGVASDFWNRYEQDIMLAQGLGARRSSQPAAPWSCTPSHCARGSARPCMPAVHAQQRLEDDYAPSQFLLKCTSKVLSRIFTPSRQPCRTMGMVSDSCWGKAPRVLRARAGSNSIRISIEWARIVPQRGVIDEEAVRHYHRIFDKIDECGSRWHGAIFGLLCTGLAEDTNPRHGSMQHGLHAHTPSRLHSRIRWPCMP